MANSSKPIVAMILPAHIHERMFSEADLAPLRELAEVIGPPEHCDSYSCADLLGEAEAAIGGWGTPIFDGRLLEAAPKLKFLAYSAGSLKSVVTEAFYDRGVRVTTAASANAVPVAQYTVAMMVCMLKQIPWLSAAMAGNDNGEITRRKALSRELQDLTIGLVGASRVGREVIRLLRDYPRLTVKVYDPTLPAADLAALGVTAAGLEEVCSADVVSLHAPNLPATKHMINAAMLARMPQHGVLINTARGALVDEKALVAEVRRRPLYVLLDVTDPEPPAAESALRRQVNIILTPHVAGAMKQACRDMGRVAIGEMIRFLKGEPLRHEVTREMAGTQA